MKVLVEFYAHACEVLIFVCIYCAVVCLQFRVEWFSVYEYQSAVSIRSWLYLSITTGKSNTFVCINHNYVA